VSQRVSMMYHSAMGYTRGARSYWGLAHPPLGSQSPPLSYKTQGAPNPGGGCPKKVKSEKSEIWKN